MPPVSLVFVATGGKIATGVNDTGGKFAAGVNGIRWEAKLKLFLAPDSNTLINVCGSYASIAPIFLSLQIEKYYNQRRKHFARLRLVYTGQRDSNTRISINICSPRRKFVA